MQLTLIRSVFTKKSTFGKLSMVGKLFAFTCEDKVRNIGENCKGKIKNQTAINPGTYEVILSFSNRFKRYLPLLLNVACFEAIRMHGGNTAEDSEGCILVGAEGDMKTRIWNCASKVSGLVAALKAIEKKEKTFITITQ